METILYERRLSMAEFPKEDRVYSINSKDQRAVTKFLYSFNYCFNNTITESFENIVLLCIGTDRSTGDCLGPLVGHKLYKNQYNNTHIVGTLDNPTHAKNLENNIKIIEEEIPNPFIIALDACLGKFDNIGHINLGPGPLKPGAGVNKPLPWVGNMYIKGIVNVGGFMEHKILQNTRLSLVMTLADIIAAGLHRHFQVINTGFRSKDVAIGSSRE